MPKISSFISGIHYPASSTSFTYLGCAARAAVRRMPGLLRGMFIVSRSRPCGTEPTTCTSTETTSIISCMASGVSPSDTFTSSSDIVMGAPTCKLSAYHIRSSSGVSGTSIVSSVPASSSLVKSSRSAKLVVALASTCTSTETTGITPRKGFGLSLVATATASSIIAAGAPTCTTSAITYTLLPFSSYAAGMLIGGTNGPGRGLLVQDTTFKKGVSIVGTNGPGPLPSTSTSWASPNDSHQANLSWGAYAGPGFAVSPVFSSSGLNAFEPFSRGGALAAGYVKTGISKYIAHHAIAVFKGSTLTLHAACSACVDALSSQIFTKLLPDIGDPLRTFDVRSTFYADSWASSSCTDPSSPLTGMAHPNENEYKLFGFSFSAPVSRGGVPVTGHAASQSLIERAHLSVIGFFISDRNAQAPFGRGGVLAMGN